MRERNLVMEGLRGVLALMVMLIHVFKMAAKVGLIAPIPGRVLEFLGPYRACVFFSLSGYLAYQTLHRNPDARRFAWRRGARIYPLFLVLHVILFISALLPDTNGCGICAMIRRRGRRTLRRMCYFFPASSIFRSLKKTPGHWDTRRFSTY